MLYLVFEKKYPIVLSLFQNNFCSENIAVINSVRINAWLTIRLSCSCAFSVFCDPCLLSEYYCHLSIVFSWACATRFPLNLRDGSNDTVEITVYDYFMKKGIELCYSGDYPCINAGKPKRPTYIPIEVCFTFASVHP